MNGVLDTTALFGALPAIVRSELSAHAEERQFARNDVIFRQGDPAQELFVVSEGRVAIATSSRDGRETVVAVLDDGSLFGEMSMFDGAPRSADARALTDVNVIVLAYEHARQVLEQRPEALWDVVRLLTARLRATDEALADAVFLDVPARTAKRLLELAGDADEFRLPVTQEELASMVGASRERVNKAISLFTRLGWLEARGRNRYRILDRPAIEARATQ
ncbi:MAG: Crp/Fnr family transcriptional regulator [Acidimicrobiia bacterium]